MYILILIFILILMNGYFSAAEIALVSIKKFKIQEEADKGNKRAKRILEYLKNPDEYLSTIQVGLTLIGLIEGLYGGEVFQKFLEPKFNALGLSSALAHFCSIFIGIGFISYVTIIIGELLPKSLALQKPLTLALRIVPSFNVFTFLAYPFVKILTVSTRFLLRLIRSGNQENQNLTDADLKSLLSLAYRQGTLEKEELKLHENIFNFYDLKIETIMTPLSSVVSISLDTPAEKTDEIIRTSSHNYFPVVEKNNNLVGYLCAREYYKDRNKSIREHTMTTACTLTKNQKASELLEKFKKLNLNFGIVVNERRELFGLVTMHDIGEVLIGKIP
jgi:putative hemolysin